MDYFFYNNFHHPDPSVHRVLYCFAWYVHTQCAKQLIDEVPEPNLLGNKKPLDFHQGVR